MYRKSKHTFSKINTLLKQKQKLFHTADLSLLWGITNPNTLYTTIKRYSQKGILIPICKGFYSTIGIDQIDPIELGIGYLHQYSYLSTETVLAQGGIISQNISYFTLISVKSRKFNLGSFSYLARRMKDAFLYQTSGIVIQNNYRRATLERAVADLLYFNPVYHLDGARQINWEKVRQIQKEVGYK